jgi:hypothetical protein
MRERDYEFGQVLKVISLETFVLKNLLNSEGKFLMAQLDIRNILLLTRTQS